MALDRFKPYGVVNLLIRRNDEILLAQRINQGWEEGNYGFISGHLEGEETATQAMIREAAEELGITIMPSDLRPIHVMHRYSNRENIDIVFECRAWRGTIANREPSKCSNVQFFPLWKLPSNLIAYVPHVMEQIKKGHLFSEFGWDNLQHKRNQNIFF